MKRFAIIGAGLAGPSCAGSLKQAGQSVTLSGKGRGPGGRMATRRMATPLGEVAFDHGAQYFTVRDPAFKRQLGIWAISFSVAIGSYTFMAFSLIGHAVLVSAAAITVATYAAAAKRPENFKKLSR